MTIIRHRPTRKNAKLLAKIKKEYQLSQNLNRSFNFAKFQTTKPGDLIPALLLLLDCVNDPDFNAQYDIGELIKLFPKLGLDINATPNKINTVGDATKKPEVSGFLFAAICLKSTKAIRAFLDCGSKLGDVTQLLAVLKAQERITDAEHRAMTEIFEEHTKKIVGQLLGKRDPKDGPKDNAKYEPAASPLINHLKKMVNTTPDEYKKLFAEAEAMLETPGFEKEHVLHCALGIAINSMKIDVVRILCQLGADIKGSGYQVKLQGKFDGQFAWCNTLEMALLTGNALLFSTVLELGGEELLFSDDDHIYRWIDKYFPEVTKDSQEKYPYTAMATRQGLIDVLTKKGYSRERITLGTYIAELKDILPQNPADKEKELKRQEELKQQEKLKQEEEEKKKQAAEMKRQEEMRLRKQAEEKQQQKQHQFNEEVNVILSWIRALRTQYASIVPKDKDNIHIHRQNKGLIGTYEGDLNALIARKNIDFAALTRIKEKLRDIHAWISLRFTKDRLVELNNAFIAVFPDEAKELTNPKPKKPPKEKKRKNINPPTTPSPAPVSAFIPSAALSLADLGVSPPVPRATALVVPPSTAPEAAPAVPLVPVAALAALPSVPRVIPTLKPILDYIKSPTRAGREGLSKVKDLLSQIPECEYDTLNYLIFVYPFECHKSKDAIFGPEDVTQRLLEILLSSLSPEKLKVLFLQSGIKVENKKFELQKYLAAEPHFANALRIVREGVQKILSEEINALTQQRILKEELQLLKQLENLPLTIQTLLEAGDVESFLKYCEPFFRIKNPDARLALATAVLYPSDAFELGKPKPIYDNEKDKEKEYIVYEPERECLRTSPKFPSPLEAIAKSGSVAMLLAYRDMLTRILGLTNPDQILVDLSIELLSKNPTQKNDVHILCEGILASQPPKSTTKPSKTSPPIKFSKFEDAFVQWYQRKSKEQESKSSGGRSRLFTGVQTFTQVKQEFLQQVSLRS